MSSVVPKYLSKFKNEEEKKKEKENRRGKRKIIVGQMERI